MKYAALLVLSAASCFAGQAHKPVCDASSRGQLWPEEANASQAAARESFQRGDLEICSLAAKKYRWERLSVNVRDLAAAKRPAASASRKSAPKENK